MATDVTSLEAQAYPVRLSMVYPERVSRWSTAFRIILVIPVLLFLALLAGGYSNWGDSSGVRNLSIGAGGSLIVAIWATILVRGRIPHWLFDFQVALNRFSYRAYAYAGLLTDQYPAFEGEWLLNYDVDYPDRLSRWRILFWKLITSLPHFFILLFLTIASFFVIFISWWAILFTGQFPRGLHRFVVGVMRWSARVTAYFESLTDVFPPFSLDEDAGPGGSGTLSAVLGGLMAIGIIAGAAGIGTAVYLITHDTKTLDVQYSDVTAGRADASARMDQVTFTLLSANDPASVDSFQAHSGHHIVSFKVGYLNERRFHPASGYDVEVKTLRLETENGGTITPTLLTIDGVVAPLDVDRDRDLTLQAYFEVANDDAPLELHAYPLRGTSRHIVWNFQ